mgnify:CR=1 FL=1
MSIRSTDPLDLEVESGTGITVRDLETVAQCTSHLMKIDDDLAVMRSQIARHEEDPTSRPAGWRSRVQNAMSHKKRVRKAITTHAQTMGVKPDGDDILASEVRRLKQLDKEYGRVEVAIIMYDPEFDGDSDHADCGDRLIASVKRMAGRAALCARLRASLVETLEVAVRNEDGDYANRARALLQEMEGSA